MFFFLSSRYNNKTLVRSSFACQVPCNRDDASFETKEINSEKLHLQRARGNRCM